MIRTYILLAFLVAISPGAFAHYLWIELQDPKLNAETEVRIFYGEFNEGVREVKGGRLEELAGIVAWVIAPDGSKRTLKVEISDKFYRAVFTPEQEGNYVIVTSNTVRGVVDWTSSDIGVVKPTYYAYRHVVVGADRKVPSDESLSNDLSIRPAAAGNSFFVSQKGKPLSNGKVLFHAPNGWSKELVTDDNGLVTFDPQWKGQYVLECIVKEKVPGAYQGKNYEAIRHRATLTIDIL